MAAGRRRGDAIPVLSSFLQEERAKTPPCQMKSAVRHCHGSCIRGSATTRANAEPHRTASSQHVPVLRTRCSFRHACCKTQATTPPGSRCLRLVEGSVGGGMALMLRLRSAGRSQVRSSRQPSARSSTHEETSPHPPVPVREHRVRFAFIHGCLRGLICYSFKNLLFLLCFDVTPAP